MIERMGAGNASTATSPAIFGEQKLSTKSLNYLNSIRAIMAEIPQIHQSRLK